MPAISLLAARLFNTPLLVQELYAQTVASVLAPRLNVQPLLGPDQMPPAKPARMPMLTDSGIMIVPVVGGLVHRGDSLDAMSGTESYTHLNNVILKGLNDKDVRAILLDVDSPGGEAGGCFELGDTLLDARGKKPIWGIANTQACSAAYMILASCTKAYASASAHIGSIGVCLLHVDMSEMLKSAGLVTSLIYAGKHKVDGNPYEPLPKGVRADLQASIDASYQLFVEAVAKRRPITADAVRATEARVFRAQEAADKKLVDGVLSFQATLEALEESLGTSTSVIADFQQGDAFMTGPTPAQPAAPAITPEAHAAAVAQATEAGRVAGRQEASEILASEHARGRENLAAAMIADAGVKPASAIAMLAKAPAAAPAGGNLAKLLAREENNPSVGVGGAEPGTDEARASRMAELAKVGKGTRLR